MKKLIKIIHNLKSIMKIGLITGLIAGILTFILCVIVNLFTVRFTLEWMIFLSFGVFIGNFLTHSLIEYFDN